MSRQKSKNPFVMLAEAAQAVVATIVAIPILIIDGAFSVFD